MQRFIIIALASLLTGALLYVPVQTLAQSPTATPSATTAPAEESGEERVPIWQKVLEELFKFGGSEGNPDNSGNERPGEPTPEPGETGTVTPPPAQAKGSAKYAEELARQLMAKCPGGVVNSSTVVACAPLIDLSTSEAVELQVKAQLPALVREGGGILQCVGFAKLALFAMHNGNAEFLKARGHAVNWISSYPPAYYKAIRVGSGATMKEGDVPIWGYQVYGHIAVHIGQKQIAEGNFDGAGKVNIRATNEGSPGLVGWLAPL